VINGSGSSGTRRAIAAVLVVDDDDGIREALRALLEDEGYRVYCAEDGIEALAMMRSQELFLVLLDGRMPGMDAAEVRRRQLEDPRLREVPVVLVTADTSIALDADVMVVRKPFEADELLEIVAAYSQSHAVRVDRARGGG
jgi:CheY-like chemotaxis protein